MVVLDAEILGKLTVYFTIAIVGTILCLKYTKSGKSVWRKIKSFFQE